MTERRKITKGKSQESRREVRVVAVHTCKIDLNDLIKEVQHYEEKSDPEDLPEIDNIDTLLTYLNSVTTKNFTIVDLLAELELLESSTGLEIEIELD